MRPGSISSACLSLLCWLPGASLQIGRVATNDAIENQNLSGRFQLRKSVSADRSKQRRKRIDRPPQFLQQLPSVNFCPLLLVLPLSVRCVHSVTSLKMRILSTMLADDEGFG